MDKIIHLSVTDSDIRQGCKGSPDNCPFARALIRATGAVWVSVNATTMHWITQAGAHWDAPCAQYKVDSPEAAAQWIGCYDRGDCVSPIQCDIVPMTLAAWQAGYHERLTALANRLGTMPSHWPQSRLTGPNDLEG